MKSLLCPSMDQLIEAHLDITAPAHIAEVTWSADKKVLWVNVDGICVLRVCRIPQLVVRRKQ